MLTLARWLARWPLWLLHALGGALGWVVYTVSPRYRQRFGEQTRAAAVGTAEAREAIAQAGRLVLEIPRLWLHGAPAKPPGAQLPASTAASTPARPLPAPVVWSGRDAIEAAHRAGGGVILLTPHLGCFEITAQAVAAEFGREMPITVMYRPARQPWLRELQRVSRDRPGLTAVPASLAGVRQMIRALRRGEAVGLLPDQVPPEGMGEWAPFFGRPAYTMTLAARLAAQTEAQVLLIWGERLPLGRGYHVRVSAWTDTDALRQGGVKAATALNRAMEQLIAQRPGQYLWGYHRHKAPRSAVSTTAVSAAAADPPPAS
jgi:Kdo2-lipid IVA lauroyltransferase/acyltransferase